MLVNNAGNDQRHNIEDVTPEYWEQSMAINLRPQFFTVQAVLPAMRAAGRGIIINMSSISWMIPSTGVPLYVAAKAAIVGLTRTLAHELGRTNSRQRRAARRHRHREAEAALVHAGVQGRDPAPTRRSSAHIVPEEVARLVLFLAADDSSAITNQSYIVERGGCRERAPSQRVNGQRANSDLSCSTSFATLQSCPSSARKHGTP